MIRGKLMENYNFIIGLVIYTILSINSIGQKSNSLIDSQFSKLLIKATGAKISGDLYTADSLYKKCLELNPNSGVVNFELSGIYRSKEDLKKAIKFAEISVESSPKNEWYLANLALLYNENKSYRKSADVFLKLTQIKPEKITYLFSLTEAYLANNKIKKGLKILNLIEDEVGINEDISIQKHQLYAFINKKNKALKELEKLVTEFPDNIRNLGLLAEYYESINKKEKSIELLQEMMNIDSTNGLVRLSMFQHYYKNGKYNKGFIELKEVMLSLEVEESLKQEILIQISYDKNSPYTLNNVNDLTKIFIEMYPKNSEILLFYGNLKFLENKEDSACFFLRKALAINPLEYEMWAQLISSSLSRGKYNDAIKDAELASESHPNQPFPFFAIGLALNAKEKYEKALKELKRGKLLVIDNNFLESDFNSQIADAYYGLNEIEKAFKYYELAIELDSNNSILLNNYSYYLSINKQNLDRAENLILKAISIRPNSPTFLDTYGWVLFQKNDFINAEQVLFKAVMLSDEKNGEILEHYADVLYKLDKRNEAIIFWEKAKITGEYSDQLLNKINEKKYME